MHVLFFYCSKEKVNYENILKEKFVNSWLLVGVRSYNIILCNKIEFESGEFVVPWFRNNYISEITLF
jgi:hypothetical protein